MSDSKNSQSSTDEDPQGETKSSQARYWLTNDVAALAFTGVLCLMMLVSLLPFYQAPALLQKAFVGGFAAAVVWLFGKGAAKHLLGGGGQ